MDILHRIYRLWPVFLSVLCVPFLLFLSSPPASGRVYLDITAASLHKVPMAIPDFIDQQKPDTVQSDGIKMADLLGKSLAFHGFLKIVPTGSYGGRPDADWELLSVDFVIKGFYEQTASDIKLELQLIDVNQNHMILGRRYRGTPAQKKQMLMKFCDETILKLTGEKGVSLSRIAFVSNSTGNKEIFVSDILGDEIKQVTRHNSIAVSPRFSPNGQKLAYTSYHRTNPNLYITDLSQSKKTRLISKKKGLNMAPAWSPDGDTLAITLSKDGNPDLYLMDTDGKIIQQLTKKAGINVSPSWSPDGNSITFVSDRSGSPQIYIMNVRNKTVRRLSYSGSYNTSPNWSPKGDWIAYSGIFEGNYHIFLIAPEGGEPVRITKTPGDHESPSWSPDGRQIAFSRTINNSKKIYTIFRNGSGMHPLFNINGEQTFPQWSPRLNL